MNDRKSDTYEGGFEAILAQMETRRDPFVFGPDEALAPLDIDLEPLKQRMMRLGAPELKRSRTSYARKYRDLAEEFEGRSALLHLHGLLIANLRRRGQPAHCAALFVRLWAEQGSYLMAHLDARWLVSAVTTFGDHGVTATQRSVGQAMSVLFGMMKLYETERLFSGQKPTDEYEWKRRSASQLAMQMDPYAIAGGGLDVNLLGRLWQEAEPDPVLAPLAQRLLTLLVEDDKTVFRRLRAMRAQKPPKSAVRKAAEKDANANIAPVVPERRITDVNALKWGTVSLVKAPLHDILGFAAHHLSLGAHEVHLYLDAPDPDTLAALSLHPKVHVTACDETFWAAQKKPRMDGHRLRQTWVSTLAYNKTDCHWLAHIDVDEFLIPISGHSMAAQLALADPSAAAMVLSPAEQLDTQGGPEKFKLTPKAVGQDDTVLQDLYPTFGDHLDGGFLSHTQGKLIARTGVKSVRLGLHSMRWEGKPVSNVQRTRGIVLGHAHAPSWQAFVDHLEFRLVHGSYRKVDTDDRLRVADMVALLRETEGEEAIRALYGEVSGAEPALLSKLDRLGMLVDFPLDLQTKIDATFGPLVEGDRDEHI
ncbi:MAG: glycosyltransferase family 2 protein [Thalassovita sp.]